MNVRVRSGVAVGEVWRRRLEVAHERARVAHERPDLLAEDRRGLLGQRRDLRVGAVERRDRPAAAASAAGRGRRAKRWTLPSVLRRLAQRAGQLADGAEMFCCSEAKARNTADGGRRRAAARSVVACRRARC